MRTPLHQGLSCPLPCGLPHCPPGVSSALMSISPSGRGTRSWGPPGAMLGLCMGDGVTCRKQRLGRQRGDQELGPQYLTGELTPQTRPHCQCLLARKLGPGVQMTLGSSTMGQMLADPAAPHRALQRGPAAAALRVRDRTQSLVPPLPAGPQIKD